MFSWSRLEPVLRLAGGWRRVGREWHGPCPVLGVGKDTSWVRPADLIPDGVLVGCRKCAPLTVADRRAHVEALCPDAVASAHVCESLAAPPEPVLTPAADISHLWRAAGSPERTVGALYLRVVRACWGFKPFPPSVRWLSSDSWGFSFIRPEPPAAAAGLLVYGFRGLADRQVAAVQVEAISSAGRRIPWPPQNAPRVSLAGSRFDSGRQRFEVVEAGTERLFLVEGPISAMAASLLFPELAQGWSIAGVAGWSGFRRQAVGNARVVRICPDGDLDGQRAVDRLVDDLLASGIDVFLDPIQPGVDLLDLYRAGGPLGPPVRLAGTQSRYAAHGSVGASDAC